MQTPTHGFEKVFCMNVEVGLSPHDRREAFARSKRTGKFDDFEKLCDNQINLAEFNRRMDSQLSFRATSAERIGMTDREVKSFSFLKLVASLAEPNSKELREAAAFEFECSRAGFAMDRNREARGDNSARIPLDVLEGSRGERAALAGTATLGGNLVATNLLASSFIDALRARLVVRQAGATILTGLVGNVAIPKLTTASIAYWVAENVAITPGVPTVGQVLMSPNSVGALVNVSRRLLLQSTPNAEELFRDDMVKQIAVAIDKAALHGAGGDEPLGLAGQSINAVTIGAQGGPLTWAKIVEMETLVGNNNADGRANAYLVNSRTRASLKSIQKVAAGTEGAFIWSDSPPGYEGGLPASMVNGYKALVSNNCANNLTKGTVTTCSSVFYGSWENLVVGEWGVIDVLVNPYLNSATGAVQVRCIQEVDSCCRNLGAFSAALDVTT
jgi:HK97 family phage major capsid protein